ncbi:hypothetical protein FQN54_009242 [Arachnomyces sp. PD_36]|nr:hypothetical protein FQN54_009242 [Arachnomyces sp. PD_36]
MPENARVLSAKVSPSPEPRHRPRPNFSSSRASRGAIVNRGSDAEIFLLDREKNPVFLVSNDGYAFTRLLWLFAAAHDFALPPLLVTPKPGLDRPLCGLYGAKPGLDHPPPGRGEGDLDNDMYDDATGAFGVPGMGLRGARPKVGPDELPHSLGTYEDSWRFKPGGGTVEDDRRRWCEEERIFDQGQGEGEIVNFPSLGRPRILDPSGFDHEEAKRTLVVARYGLRIGDIVRLYLPTRF